MIVGVDWSQQLFRLGRRSVDMAMEASVVGSFTKIGYNVRSRMYDWDALPDMTGRTVVITGATSGLGRAAADELGAFGAELILVGRDKRRTQTAARSIAKKHGGSVQVVIADLGELDSVREASVELAQLSRIDALIHNAGALTNTYEVTSDGFERTFATHVLGPFAMTRELLERHRPDVMWYSGAGDGPQSLLSWPKTRIIGGCATTTPARCTGW